MMMLDKKPGPSEMAACVRALGAKLNFEIRDGMLFAIETSYGEAMRVRSGRFQCWCWCEYKAYFGGDTGMGDEHMRAMISGIERIARARLAASPPRLLPPLSPSTRPRGGPQASIGGDGWPSLGLMERRMRV